MLYTVPGGGRKVIRCELSLDGGETWRLADIERHEKPTRLQQVLVLGLLERGCARCAGVFLHVHVSVGFSFHYPLVLLNFLYF